MEWQQSQFIYNVTTAILDRSIEGLFNLAGDAITAFSVPLQAAAAIYIALIGYSVMTGVISMSVRDLSIQFAKVIGIIVIAAAFERFGNDLFEEVWDIPDGIAEYFVVKTAPILEMPASATALLSGDIASLVTSNPTTLDNLTGMYSGLASVLGDNVTQARGEGAWPLMTWIVAMIPLALTIVGIYLAKFVAAILFLVSPVVFILSLVTGGFRGNSVLSSWFKALAVTFLTVIIVYTVGVVCMVMMTKYMIALVTADFLANLPLPDFLNPFSADGFQYTLVQLAPLGIIAMFSVILISQASSVASKVG